MKVNVGLTALNTLDWDRYESGDVSGPPVVADHYMWDRLVEIGDLAEPLGFDGIWAAEHFATPYTMTPNPLQTLAFFAGRTERIDMGTMVCVLPWWNPVRFAHQVAFLDILLKGRKINLGVGRGISRLEFEPLGIPQSESRQRFMETLDILELALSNQRFSYEGEIYRIPETSLRPQPRSTDLFDRVFGAFTSDSSMEIIARRGLRPMMVGAKPLAQTRADMVKFNTIRQEIGLPPTQPKQLAFAYCTARPQDTEKGVAYFRRYGLEAAQHYGLRDPKNFEGIAGYEEYHLRSQQPRTSDDWLDNSMIGTPDVIIERIVAQQEIGSFDEITVVFNFGGMDFEDSMRSMRLFAQEVLPEVHRMESPLHATAIPQPSAAVG